VNARLPQEARSSASGKGFGAGDAAWHGGLRVLVSVRDVREALTAAAAGVDLIDLKEPARGALGGLDEATLRAIVAAVRDAGHPAPLSATIGDHGAEEIDAVHDRVLAVAACGVDVVKVGVEPGAWASTLLRRLADWQATHALRLVPVLMADDGVPESEARIAAELGFEAVMLDTARKRDGSLLKSAGDAPLRGFLALMRSHGVPAGLAGALRRDELPALRALAPGYAGFRSAVCAGDRAGALDEALLRELLAAAHVPADRAGNISEPR